MREINTGADLTLHCLEELGVDTIFGYPGGANLPLYTALIQSKIQHILTRHEQGAVFAAQGYARSTGKLGVASATSGPGIANTLTAVTDAFNDHVGLLVLAGQVATPGIGKRAFQELPTEAIFSHVTKYAKQIRDPRDIRGIIEEACHIATEGVPGPVLVDIPKDIAMAAAEDGEGSSAQFQKPRLNPEQVREAKEMLQSAKRPVMLIGQGVKLSGAHEELRLLAEQLGIPTVETLLAKGVMNHDSPDHHGMLGMHGFYEANMATYNADLILNIGSRFDDRIVGTYESFPQNKKIIHVDIDAEQLGFYTQLQPDLGIHADAKDFINALRGQMGGEKLSIGEWRGRIEQWRNEHPYEIGNDMFGGKQVLGKLNELIGDMDQEPIIATDVGQHQMIASQTLHLDNPMNRLSSGGFGSMGFSLPAAIGAAVADPQKKVLSIVGDGGVQMTMNELGIILQQKQLNIQDMDLKTILLDNGRLGMVNQWQVLVDSEEVSQVQMISPDFEKVADAYSIGTHSFSNMAEIDKGLESAISQKGSALIYCPIDPKEHVFPMIPGGNRLDQMIFG